MKQCAAFIVICATFAILFALPTQQVAAQDFATFVGHLVPCGQVGSTANCPANHILPCTTCHFWMMLHRVLMLLVFLGAVLAAIMFIRAGFTMLGVTKNTGILSTAKERFMNTLWGFVIVLSAWLVVDVFLKAFYDSEGRAPWDQIICNIPIDPTNPASVGSCVPLERPDFASHIPEGSGGFGGGGASGQIPATGAGGTAPTGGTPQASVPPPASPTSTPPPIAGGGTSPTPDSSGAPPTGGSSPFPSGAGSLFQPSDDPAALYPSLTISASPSTIAPGGQSTITWNATDATACTASGAWSGARSTSGSVVVSPSVTSTYSLLCNGTLGSISRQFIVNVQTESEMPDTNPVQAVGQTINQERTSRGLPSLTVSSALSCAAQAHSVDMASTGECGHTGSDGSRPADRVNACGGIGYGGEIVACGQPNAQEAVDAWLNSPSHRAILLGSSYTQIGVSMHNNYWTAVFGN